VLGDDHQRGRLVDTPSGLVRDAVLHLDPSWRFSYVSEAVGPLLGRRVDEVIDRDMLDCFPLVRGTELEKRLHVVMERGEPQSFEYLHEPWQRWFEVRAYPDSLGVTVFIRDIDEHRRLEQRREAETQQLTAVLDSLPAPTVLVGEDGAILLTNRAWQANGERLRSVGVEPARVGDDYLESIALGIDAADHRRIVDGIRRLMAEPHAAAPGKFDLEYAACLSGPPIWFHMQASRVENSGRVVVSHIDVTERVRSQQALVWRASHDDLTGLPNRACMLEQIGEALSEYRSAGPSFGLLFIDLDGFKTVNDSLGHQVGDSLLRQVAARLAEQVRPGDAVGRLGGDQFLVLARGCDSSEAAALAFRLQGSVRTPFPVEGISVPLSASIGVAVSGPDCAGDAHGLLGDADAAVYAAKAAGRDRFHLFSPGLREAARWRLEVATRLRDGAVDELVVHYQPVIRLDTGAVEGVEALVRWQHPERGLLPPDTFLTVAEETGQLIPITRWLLRETTARAAQWAAQGLRLRMAVNISARHFSAETLVRDVRAALRDSGLPPDQLMLELTETSLAEDPGRAEDQLTVLRALGVRVAIDDFGTGWSSLAQLLALPIGTLKIDRSLLTAAERVSGPDSGAVLSAIVALTRTLGIRSVAEGVETPEHLQLVRNAGCDSVQGWLVGYPMPGDDVPAWVRRLEAAGIDAWSLVRPGEGR
jgi:diguanylate cyclase (GGDEF)-like protein